MVVREVAGVIGGGLAALLWAGRNNRATSDLTETAFRVLGNPVLWVSLVMAMFVVSTLVRRLRGS